MKKLLYKIKKIFGSGFNAGKSLISQKRLIYAGTKGLTPETTSQKPKIVIDVKEFSRKQQEQLKEFQRETHTPVNVPPEANLTDAINALDQYFDTQDVIGKMAEECMEHNIMFTYWTRFKNNPFLFPNRIKPLLPPGSAAARLGEVTQNPDHPGYPLVIQFFQKLMNRIEEHLRKSDDPKKGEFLNYAKEELMAVQTGSITEKLRRKREMKGRLSEQMEDVHVETQGALKEFFEDSNSLGLVYNRVDQNKYNFYEWTKNPADPTVQRELLTILPKGPASQEFLNDLKLAETNQRNVKAKELLAFIVTSLDKWQKQLEKHRELREKTEAGLYGPIKNSLKTLGKKFRDGSPAEKGAIAAAVGIVTYAFYRKWKESENETLKDLVRYGVVLVAGDYLVGQATGHSLAKMANESLLQDERDELKFAKSLESLGFDKNDTELMTKASTITNVKASQLLPWYIIASKTADKRELDPKDVGIDPNLLTGQQLFDIMHNIIGKDVGGMGIPRFRKEFIENGDHSLAEIIMRTYDKDKFDKTLRTPESKLESVFKKYRIEAKTYGSVNKVQMFGGFLEDYDVVARKGGGTIYKFPKINEEIVYNTGLPNEDSMNRAAIKRMRVKYRKQLDALMPKRVPGGNYDPNKLKFSGGKWYYEYGVKGNGEYGVADNSRYRIVVVPSRDGTDLSFEGATDIGRTKTLDGIDRTFQKVQIGSALEGTFDFMQLPTVGGSTEVMKLSFDPNSVEATALQGQVRATVKGTEVFATFDQATSTWKLDKIGEITPEFAKAKAELLKKNKRWFEAFETLGLGMDNAPEKHWPADWYALLDVKISGAVVGEYYQQLVRNKREELLETYERELAKISPPDVLVQIKNLEDRVIRQAYTHVLVRNAQLSERIAELNQKGKKMEAAEFEQFCREFETIGVHEDFYPFLHEFRKIVYGGESGFNLEGFDKSEFSKVNHQIYFILKDSFMKYVGKFAPYSLKGAGNIRVEGKVYNKEHVRKYIYWIQVQYQNWLNRLMDEPYPKGDWGEVKDLWGLWKKVKLPEIRAYIDGFEANLEPIDTFIATGGPGRIQYPNGGKIPPLKGAYEPHEKPPKKKKKKKKTAPATGLPPGVGGGVGGGAPAGAARPSAGPTPDDFDAYLRQPELIDKGGRKFNQAEIKRVLDDVTQAYFNKYSANPDFDFGEVNRVYNIIKAGSLNEARAINRAPAANRKKEFQKRFKEFDAFFLLYTLKENKVKQDEIKDILDDIDNTSTKNEIKTELLKVLNNYKDIFTNVKLNNYFEHARFMGAYNHLKRNLDSMAQSVFDAPRQATPQSKKSAFKLFSDTFEKTFYTTSKKF